MQTIEPDIQEAILDALPNDGSLALKLMAQLIANMLLSIKDANVNNFINDLKLNLQLYEGT